MLNFVCKALMAAALLFALSAAWMPAKAWLSQQLIAYSWQQALQTNQQVKPWPWADTFAIAEINFSRLGKDIVVLNGGDPTTLAFSAGAVAPFNQSLAQQPFVVAGHRDSHFSFLQEVSLHDIITLQNKLGQHQMYQVVSMEIIDASIGELPISADEPNLVLITCYPFNQLSGNSTERYVITAMPI